MKIFLYFFMLYLKSYIMVWDNASFKLPLLFKSIPFWLKFINCTNSIVTESSWLWRSTFNDKGCFRHIADVAFTGPITQAIKVGFWWLVQPNCNSVKKTLTRLFAVFLFKPGIHFTSKSAKVVEWLLCILYHAYSNFYGI